ncbi:chorismate mutase 2 isoform X2 [Vigna radiata var. radiata]|uniref:chorismate mutase n=1 Tax=Vigna radiata var. radiata TaxID=3916 RepID=A0A1S3TXZ8_VIGRR|nr:chorismate mutase 2 isoform X2 [Vigna radiata var. radiata]
MDKLELRCKECPRRAKAEYNDDTVRASLARLEDTIIFALFERVKFPLNPPTYDLLGDLVRETEALQFKARRYDNPEENPFFPENLPPFAAPEYPFPEFLQGAGASININKEIWELYFNELLPKFVKCGDDGNYAQTAFADLTLLQAISKRIHYGKFFAEIRFRRIHTIIEPYIRAKNRRELMRMATIDRIENMVVRRVEAKVMVFGREVSQEHDFKGRVSILYEKWLIPLTKKVEVEYLLKRLD